MKIQDFLKHHAIGRNPFAEEDAQTDVVFKDHCIDNTFHVGWDKVFGDPNDPSTSIVFGEKGSGKTALKLQIKDHVDEHNKANPNNQLFVINYDDFNPYLDRFRDHFGSRFRRPDKLLSAWRLWDHMDAILSQGVTQLTDSIIAKDGPNSIPKAKLRKLPKHQKRDLLLLTSCYDQPKSDSNLSRWKQVRKRVGFWTWKANFPFKLGILGLLLAALLFGWVSLANSSMGAQAASGFSALFKSDHSGESAVTNEESGLTEDAGSTSTESSTEQPILLSEPVETEPVETQAVETEVVATETVVTEAVEIEAVPTETAIEIETESVDTDGNQAANATDEEATESSEAASGSGLWAPNVPWWVYPLIIGLAWIPWLVKAIRRTWLAGSVVRRFRVGKQYTNPLRKTLMNFTSRDVLGQPFPNKDRTDDRYELLGKFQNVLEPLGYSGVLVLMDRLDEPHLINGQSELMQAFLWPLLDNKFLKHPGVGIKMMLPIELRRYIDREDRDFYQRARLDKQNMIPSLQWTGSALYDLASDRISAVGVEGGKPNLRQIFDESVTDQRLIEGFQSLRTPRHLFKFLYRLLVAHCNSHTDDKPDYAISNHQFESVLAVYAKDIEAADAGIGV